MADDLPLPPYDLRLLSRRFAARATDLTEGLKGLDKAISELPGALPFSRGFDDGITLSVERSAGSHRFIVAVHFDGIDGKPISQSLSGAPIGVKAAAVKRLPEFLTAYAGELERCTNKIAEAIATLETLGYGFER